MSQIAEWIGISRQAIYTSQKRFDQCGDLREKIIGFVQDRFLDVLRHAGLLLRRKRAPKSISASAAERAGRQDLAHKLSVAGPGHLWVQDDTEVVILQGKAHLALSTDAYSRKVVGYSWSRQANSEHVHCWLKNGLGRSCAWGDDADPSQ